MKKELTLSGLLAAVVLMATPMSSSATGADISRIDAVTSQDMQVAAVKQQTKQQVKQQQQQQIRMAALEPSVLLVSGSDGGFVA